ncbi:OmpA family protein [Nesterenkonia massiliensis]|uniref:OmpA family protein n=1 Tax=Nesterenkonia massiliensis TaxID=1232429 RepID=A0ABT2HSB7_9MICC|nr:OmpA family protein [Nesterenkonia massiliensis]MCT1607582.1 OmpA family protein [Nesterenkonia massiliensis]
MKARAGRAAVWMIGVLALVSCGAPGESVDHSPSESASPSSAASADGFWRDEALPEAIAETVLQLPAPEDSSQLATAKLEVLSLDSDGEYARLVAAWLPSQRDTALGSTALSSHKHRYEATPFIRLADRETGELIEPLRGESNVFDYHAPPQIEPEDEPDAPSDAAGASGQETVVPGRGTCICSMLSGAAEGQPDRTELIFVDFPLPEADVVDIVLGEWAEPVPEVPITQNEPFIRPDPASSWFFTHTSGEDPPERYGAGARYAVRYPLAARTETLSGVTTTIEEQTQEVSLPADVLFEFGSAELNPEATSIIESAAEKLNEEAAGSSVTVEGHTDNVGSAELNQELSQDRAEAVLEVIEDMVDDSITLETIGYGFTRPQVPNLDADGEPIPENQARNRRVSFRYPVVVQEAAVEIDLGQAGVQDLPEAEPAPAGPDALASFIIEAPPGDTSGTDIRFDVRGAQREGNLVTMRFGLASAKGIQHRGTVFTGNPERGGAQHFGDNPQGDGNSPGLANMSLIDATTDRRYFPLGSGDMGCLCTEVAGTVETLPVQPSPMYAQFHLPQELQGPVIVHLPDAGQFQLPQDVLDQLLSD